MQPPEHNKILNTSIDGASSASTIKSPDKQKQVSMEDMLKCMQDYFNSCPYECAKNYSDGYNIELIKDNLDPATLLISLTKIVFDDARSADNLSDDRKLELSLIFQSIKNLFETLRISNNSVACDRVLCRIIGYCMRNYSNYK